MLLCPEDWLDLVQADVRLSWQAASEGTEVNYWFAFKWAGHRVRINCYREHPDCFMLLDGLEVYRGPRTLETWQRMMTGGFSHLVDENELPSSQFVAAESLQLVASNA
jgi:hypothetical protein